MSRSDKTPEQQARDMLDRMGVENAQDYTAGDVVELANVIAQRDDLYDALNKIVIAYDAYRARGVMPAPTQYAGVVEQIIAARAALAKAGNP